MDNYSEFTKNELEAAFSDTYKMLTQNKFPVKEPTVHILGGQSGAGKTTIHDIIKKQNANFIVIDGDRYREKHPNFRMIQQVYGKEAANYTQMFANSIADKLIKKLSSEHYNLIIEGTCRTAEVPLNTCSRLKEKGYRTELDVMCTDKEISWQSTIDRYNAMQAHGLTPRAVPRDKYLDTVKAIPGNISRIYKSKAFDEIKLYNREARCLYAFSKQPDVNPAQIVSRILNGQEQVQKPKTFAEGLAELVQRTQQENSRSNINRTTPTPPKQRR